jgi:hypothetical protein
MNKLLITLVFIVFLAASCTEKVTIKLDSTYTRLVVDGHIAADTMAYTVNLTTTSDYFSNTTAPRVVNATVSLTDGTNTFPLTESIAGISGVYRTQPKFAGSIGKTYTLDITLPQAIAGQTYYTAACELPGVTKLDSIQAELNTSIGKDGIWEVKIFAQDPPGQKNYYMMNLYRNGKLWSDTLDKVRVTDNQFFAGNYINGAVGFYINNSHAWETLYPGDTIMVELSGITKEYYNFINEVRQAGFSIPFFSGPPANVESNVSNNGVGFFSAYSSSYATIIVR